MSAMAERPGAPAFEGAALAYLRLGGIEIATAAGDVVVRRGETGKAFWVVLDGRVEVRLTGDDGVHLPLARLGPGASFGEMALITGDPVSADVVALEPTRLLRYPGERFAGAVGESEPLRTAVMARLAANLKGTSAEAWNFYQRAKALDVLVDPHRDEGPLVAESGAMRPLVAQIAAAGAEEAPVLVCGDPGTGKLFVAASIHGAAGRREAPIIVVDCRSLDPGEAMRFLFGSAGGIEGADGPAGGLNRCGALQLAHGGTLVLRHPELAAPAVQESVARYLAGRRLGAPAYPAARVIATTARPPAQFAAAVAPALAAELAGRVLLVPRMSERRKDVLALARIFLARPGHPPGKELSRSAEHALLSLRYEHRNAAELREAVEMAAIIADGPLIGGEHIFSGPKDEGSVHEVDLTPLPIVRRLTSPAALRLVRAAVFAAFAAILAATLLRPGAQAGALANAATWALWEPALFLVFFGVGRLWCTICPISAAGRLAQRLRSLDLPPPAWLKNASGWLIAGGFLLIVWSEHAFHMTEQPRATGLLLLALFGAAVASGVVFRRETWCRYLCPLGNLGAVSSLGAVLNVRSNPNVCATACSTHECFKGSESRPGCPVFHHPLYASDSYACKLCFQCLRVCPHGSARLSLRLPLQGIWAQTEVGGALVPFALFVFFFAPAMLGAQGASWASSPGGFTATALLAVAATAAAQPLLPRLLAPDGRAPQSLAPRTALAMLVLAWGPAMAYQLRHVHELARVHLQGEPGSLLARLLPAGEVSLLVVLQAEALLAAGLAAAVCFAGIRSRLRREGAAYSRRGWSLLLVACLLYLVGCLALILPRAPG
jgi:transcriptional regulator with AAA-type ATPase domain/NAD-dependent dihydropyrimidine dehydrogenase PreA subunit